VSNNKRSLVLITVDCLRADHCGFYGYSRPTTPLLDSLAEEAFVCDGHSWRRSDLLFVSDDSRSACRSRWGGMWLACSGRSYTGDRIACLRMCHGRVFAANPYISPRFGYDQGLTFSATFLDFEAKSVPEGASAEASPDDSVRGKLNRSIRNLAGAVGLSRLYDELYFQYCMKIAPPAKSIDGLRRFPAADVLVDEAQAWLASVGEQPFFLWLHLMDPHSPYYPAEDAFRELREQASSLDAPAM